ncbi:serine/threonine-protein kinase [Nocardia cyriacigeorgica]|uniref:non-specific serine/threonine protein kinase n=1 Tax=Nocardia cyriacigeorgica TaxID=135487 RepID=A0A6P1D226_9NOCA|nr:serine/threonine-protein kinase [Nocardia cyriacigeorgica]NEW43584.1 protein kinase [Nocardia cyriacigeorgica]
MVLRLGEPFADYRIEQELGAGGMGVVYRATHPRLPRTVALKVLDPAKAGRRNIQLFSREADLVCGLSHTNIVMILDRGETDGVCWIEMEYVDGPNAAELLSREPHGLDPDRAVHIIGDAAAGLDYAHRNNVVHRDIKPSNLLVATVDGRERTLVADFGIARSLADGATLTRAGMREYTPHYVAPERFVSSVPDHRSDIYSLGATLYQLLTGSVPYPSRGDQELINAHRNEPAPVPTLIRPSLPAAMHEVIAKAMAKDPGQRFQSCGELTAAARAALGGAPPYPDEPSGNPAPARMAPSDPAHAGSGDASPHDTTSTTRESVALATTTADPTPPDTAELPITSGVAASADPTNAGVDGAVAVAGAAAPVTPEAAETSRGPAAPREQQDSATSAAGANGMADTSAEKHANSSFSWRAVPRRLWPIAGTVVVGAVAAGVVLFSAGTEPGTPAEPGAGTSTGAAAELGGRIRERCYWPIRIPADNGTYFELPSREQGHVDAQCILNQGDRGDGVAAVQRALTLCHSIPLSVNGIYDHPTMTAVRHLQQERGVKVDGIYGPQTRTEVLEWPVFRESDGEFDGTCGRSD